MKTLKHERYPKWSGAKMKISELSEPSVGGGERKGGEACKLVTRILIVYAICANIKWIQLY